MGEIYVKIFRDARYTVVAACDEELLGRTFREGTLNLEVRREFYEGRLLPLHQAVKAMEAADVANLVGEKIVSAAIDGGLIHPASVVRIGGIPHAQIVKL